MSAGHTFFHMLHIEEQMIPVIGAGTVAVALTGLGLAVRYKLRNPDEHLIPAPGVSLMNISTALGNYFKGLLNSIIGHGSEKYVPFVGSIFLFILLCNYSGFLPGWLPPTESLNTAAAMAVSVFVFYNVLGLKEHGFHYFKQFTGGLPVPGYGIPLTIFLTLVAGLVFIIEMVGHIFRPVSLSLRLVGNITGDHILLGTVSELVPLVVPMLAMALGLFVGLIQALVFSLLTTVYIKLAVSHDH